MWSNGCIGCTKWLWGANRQEPGPNKAAEIVQNLTPKREKMTPLPDVVTRHTMPSDLEPKEIAPVPDVIGSHTMHTPDLKRDELAPVPDSVSSHIHSDGGTNSDGNSQAKPDSEAIDTVWDLVQEVKIATNASKKKVLGILERVSPELDKYSEYVPVLRKFVSRLLNRLVEKHKIAQKAGFDVAEIIQEVERSDASSNDITVEQVKTMVDGMRLVVQDVKKSIEKDEKHLGTFKEELVVVQEEVKKLKIDIAKSVEIAQDAIRASEFAIEQISRWSNLVKGSIKVIEGETPLEAATGAKATSIEILEIAKERKECARKKLDEIAEILTATHKAEEEISKEIQKAKRVEKYIETELDLLGNSPPLIVKGKC
ncbi:MAG: hypothetical protein V3581_01600 [Candidatus Cardinium sp.]